MYDFFVFLQSLFYKAQNMKRFFFFSLFCAAVSRLSAQTNYQPGYVITLDNDTLYGKIDYRTDYTLGSVCRFEDEQGMKSEFSPYDIAGYRFTNDRYFVVKEIDGKKHFLEYLIQGRLDIYYLRDNTGNHYFMDKSDARLTKIPYTEGIRYKEDTGNFYYQSTLHNGILNYYMQDVPQMKKKIDKVKKPDHQSLIKIAKNYHYAVCNDGEKCIVFMRPTPLLKAQLEPFVNYFMPIKYTSDKPITIGLNVYLWLPRVNENWYFKTGFHYLSLETQYYILRTKIPIQGAYVYPKGKLRPIFAGGINLYGLQLPLPAYSAGLLVPCNKHVSFTLNAEIETLPLGYEKIFICFLPSLDVIDLSFSLGLRYTF